MCLSQFKLITCTMKLLPRLFAFGIDQDVLLLLSNLFPVVLPKDFSALDNIKLLKLSQIQLITACDGLLIWACVIEALPGVLRIRGEGIFIFMDLGRWVIYFQ